MRDKFSVLLALVLLAVGIARAGFDFEFVCRDDTVRQIAPGGSAEYHFTLTNTGTVPDVYRLDCRIVDSVPGWVVVTCARGRCVEPGTPLFDTCAAGESDSTIDVAVYAGTANGDELVSIRVTSLGDTTLVDSISVLTRAGSGMAESENCQPQSRAALISVVNGCLMVRDVGSAVLLNSTGRKLLDLAPGANDVRRFAPGVYFMRRGREADKVLIL